MSTGDGYDNLGPVDRQPPVAPIRIIIVENGQWFEEMVLRQAGYLPPDRSQKSFAAVPCQTRWNPPRPAQEFGFPLSMERKSPMLSFPRWRRRRTFRLGATGGFGKRRSGGGNPGAKSRRRFLPSTRFPGRVFPFFSRLDDLAKTSHVLRPQFASMEPKKQISRSDKDL